MGVCSERTARAGWDCNAVLCGRGGWDATEGSWEQMAKTCVIIEAVKLAFDEAKATQAAALFLKLAGRPLNYMALIKLLYKADREAFRRLGLSITTDKYVAMKLGPVTSHIYDLIKASKNPNPHPTFWSAHIQPSKDPREVVLKCDPSDSELSKVEEDLMAEIFAADGTKDRFELADECHRDFPEWADPEGSSTPIDISDIVSALDLSEDEATHVATLIEVQRAAFSLAR
jgi:uncharacterized phage-associated protein